MGLKIGDLVRFNHERCGGPVHRVFSVMSDGMIEIHDMGGYFAPHLFVVADDVAAIPPAHDLVERLRQYSGKSWETTECYNGVRDEAADTITRLRADLAAAERVIVAKDDALIHIEEYWNRSETDGAMSDALHEIIGTAQNALALTPDKLANMRLVKIEHLGRAKPRALDDD